LEAKVTGFDELRVAAEGAKVHDGQQRQEEKEKEKKKKKKKKKKKIYTFRSYEYRRK
jgi:hypothetical protein